MFVNMKLLNARKKNKCADLVSHLSKMKLHLNSFLNSAAKKKLKPHSWKENFTYIYCFYLYNTMYCMFMCIFYYIFHCTVCFRIRKPIAYYVSEMYIPTFEM